ncbi:MAG: DEAD/DEAH box helicase [Candidatus Buchananbacteria bacterium]|nr:DEAD/DEAH box helicase [Candidatus Buchananbacteria bacterium]
MSQSKVTAGFNGLGIAPSLLEILAKLNFTTPTAIQAQAIPIAVTGKDIIGIAQTGTGKTLAFGIPLIQRLAQIKKQGLVVLPTRELALQVDEVLAKLGRGIGLKTAVLIGGASMYLQKQALRKNPHVLIATPGRLIDHLGEKTVRLNNTGVVVFDEADRMLDMGFLPQIKKILEALPPQRQMMLFSATMPPEIMKIASSYMQLPTPVEIAPTGTTASKVTMELFIVQKEQKIHLLQKILEQHRGSALVFTRTKYGAKKVAQQVRNFGVTASEIHSNRSLGQRKEALEGFKSGRYRVLAATDIASRGIDVVGIELVINFDLPASTDDYVHRIGRTARASASGHAITFAMPNERREVRDIERLIRKPLPVSALPNLPQVKRTQSAIDQPHHFSSRSNAQSSQNNSRRRRPPTKRDNFLSQFPNHSRRNQRRRPSTSGQARFR